MNLGPETPMSAFTIVLVILIVAFFAVLPTWPHSSNWGYYPSLFIALLILIAAFMARMGQF